MKKYKIKQLEAKYTKRSIFAAMPLLIIIGKFIRYTIMKKVLVDTSIGHYMLIFINRGYTPFTLLSDEGKSAATGNATWLLHFLKYFGLKTYTEYEIAITILWNILLVVLLKNIKKRLTTGQAFFTILSIIVLNIFDFNLAKEPVQMLYFVGIYYAIVNEKLSIEKKYIAVVLIILFSVITYRSYYILLLFFAGEAFVLFQLFSRKKKKIGIIKVLLMAVVLVLTYYVLLNVCRGASPLTFAELYRVRNRASTAASDMRVLFHSSNLLIFCVDYFIMILRMLFPVELLRLGIKYAPYTLYQIVLSFNVIKAIRKNSVNSKEQNLALYVYLGFLLASGTFEPDFGSWVRHESVCFPLFLIINQMTEMKEKINEEEKKNGAGVFRLQIDHNHSFWENCWGVVSKIRKKMKEKHEDEY